MSYSFASDACQCLVLFTLLLLWSALFQIDTACVEGTADCDEGTLIVDVVEATKLPPVRVSLNPNGTFRG